MKVFSFLKKIWQHMKVGEKRIFFMFVALMMIGAGLESLGLTALFAFVNFIAVPTKSISIPGASFLTDWLSTQDPNAKIKFMGIALLVLYFLKNLYLGSLYFFQNFFLLKKKTTLANSFLSYFLHQPYLYHLSENSSTLISKVSKAPGIVDGIYVPCLTFLSEVIVSISILTALLWIKTVATGMAMAIIGISTVFCYKLVRLWVMANSKKQFEFGTQTHKILTQGLGGIKEVKLLHVENYILKHFSESNFQSGKATSSNNIIVQLPRLFIETVLVFTITLFALWIIAKGQETASLLSILTMYAAAMFRLMPSMNRLIGSAIAIRDGVTTYEMVDVSLTSLEKNDAFLASEEKLPFALDSKISIKDLSYQYPIAKEKALDKVNLEFNRGDCIGFVGHSGAGKSTLVDIFIGLLEPTQGKIIIDEKKDIQGNIRGWQSLIGYVPQTIYLSDESIRSNVAFGISDGEIDDQKVIEALKTAQLFEFVETLPKGVHTFVGERGVRLSGGQKQRIGIARALYRNPKILVFDEATSALDNETERALVRSMELLIGKKTMLIVAHRLSTVQFCNKLFFFEKGKVIDSGSYKELLAQNPSFRKMAFGSEKEI